MRERGWEDRKEKELISLVFINIVTDSSPFCAPNTELVSEGKVVTTTEVKRKASKYLFTSLPLFPPSVFLLLFFLFIF